MSLQDDIDRGLELHAKITELQQELKLIQARVETAALRGNQIPLEDPERDGMQYLATGSEKIVPVIITADFLRASFGEDSDSHRKIRAVLSAAKRYDQLPHFYKATTKYERAIDDGKVFRRYARELLSPPDAEAFIKACVTTDKHGLAKSAVKIEWARARESEVTA